MTANLLVEHVPARAVGRDREADIPADRCRPQGERLDGPGSEVDLADHQEAAFLDWVSHREDAGHEPGLIGRFVERPGVQPASSRLRRHRQVPRVHLLQRCGVVNQDLMPKDVEELAVGREPNREAIIGRLEISGPRDGSQHLVCGQIVVDELRRRNTQR